MSRLLSAVCAAVAFCAFALPSWADTPGVSLSAEERAYLAAREPIRYAPDPSFPPFEFLDHAGEAHGVTPELLARMGKKLGVRFKTVAYPTWSAVLAGMERGEADLLGTLTLTPERERFLLFSRPYLSVPYVLFVRRDGPAPASLGEAASFRLGVVKNYGINAWLAAEHPEIRPVTVEDTAAGLVQVSTGQLDALLETLPVGLFTLRQKSLTNLRMVPRHIYSLPQHLAVRKGDEMLLGILQKGLDALTEAERTEIFVKWTGEDFSRPSAEIPPFVRNAALTLLALLALSLLWVVTLKRGVARGTRALRESEARYRLLADNSLDVIWIMDVEGRFTYVSPSVEKLRGYTVEEVMRQRFDEALTPQSYAVAQEAFRETLERDARGEPYVQPKPFLLEQPRKDGSTVWTEVITTPVRDAGGKIVAVQGVTRDVSERVRAEAERERLEEELRHAQKMKAVGSLAGGIAHDFNNILAAVVGYADLSLQELPKGSRQAGYVEQILKAAYRARDLVQQILAISRKAPQERHVVDLVLIVRETLKLLRATLPATIEIAERIGAVEAKVFADPVKLQQIVMNLCTNAHYAMREQGGVLEVVLEADAEAPRGLPPGRNVRLTVRDTGTGIAPEVLPHIFEPYFTTKPLGEGSGLGLAVVHGIVTHAGGAIWAESGSGKGSAFTVCLPLADDQAEEAPALPPAEVSRGTERILFVDDEPAVAEAGGKMLEALGYRVTVLTDSVEALGLFCENSDAFDLVCTDQTLPKMTGEELTKRLLAIRPGLPVVICTGRSDILDEAGARQAGARELAMKPLDSRTLSAVIRRALNAGRKR